MPKIRRNPAVHFEVSPWASKQRVQDEPTRDMSSTYIETSVEVSRALDAKEGVVRAAMYILDHGWDLCKEH